MAPGLLFIYGVVSALLVVNALRSPKPPKHRIPPLWLPAMVASEAAGLWLLVMPVVVGVAVAVNALWHPVGTVGLALTALAWMGQAVVWRRSWTGARAVGIPVPHTGRGLRRVSSRPPSLPENIDRRTLELGPHPYSSEPLRMDLYRQVGHSQPLPLIVYVHGGGWRGGNPRQTGQALI